jgi:hypothetical protein
MLHYTYSSPVAKELNKRHRLSDRHGVCVYVCVRAGGCVGMCARARVCVRARA